MQPPFPLLMLVLLLQAGCASTPGRSEVSTSPRDLHGGFTGGIKPVLYVRDVQASARCFREVLGFELLGFAGEEDAPYYADLRAGGRKLGLHAPVSASDERKLGRQKLYLRVRDVAAHRRRVIAWGAEAGPLRETEWMTLFTVVDPDGHEIVFAETDPARHSIDPW